MNSLYVDIGSTNIKWRMSEKEGSFPFPSPIKEEFPYYEVSISKIVDAVKDIILTTKPKKVFFSVQMHGYVLLKNGKAVTEYVSWRDERAKDVKPDFILSKEFGVDIKPNLPRLSVLTQKVDFDEFCSLGSYLSYVLTGNNVSHVTDLAPTGFYNVKQKYSVKTNFNLPKIVYDLIPVGKYNDAIIFAPVGDQQASVFGITPADGYVLNLGTAGQICLITENFIDGEFECRPYFFGKWLLTVTRLPGGGIISKYTDEEIFDTLVTEYKKAINKLPKKSFITVTGGLVKYRKSLLEKVLKELDLDYAFNDQGDALNGLKLLNQRSMQMRKTGLMLSEIPFSNSPVLMKNSGLDFFIIDCEHGGFDYVDVSRIIMTAKLCNLEVIIRLPNNQRKDIIKYMDMGADGLLLPMTNTAEDILEVVKYAKYQPIGERGISTMRAHTLYNPPKILDYIESANARTKVFAQIETKKGVENLEEIISVNGVDGAFIGPNDLSADYGVLGTSDISPVLETIDKVASVCKKLDKLTGIITGKKDFITKAKEKEFNYFCKGSELNALSEYCKKIKKEIEE